MADLRERSAREAIPIGGALEAALLELPASCRAVAAHILKAGGKRMRPLLTVLCARLFGWHDDDIYRLAISMELLHAATLLHDDVLDNAESRRGAPCAHAVFGSARAILAGDAMLALGNSIVASYGMPALCGCYAGATALTAAGEIMEMDALGRPDLDHASYIAIARGKTGQLIAHACELGAIRAGAGSEQRLMCARFGENLGIAFQIVDDALDFAPTAQTGKPMGGDLRERKLTPPLRLYRASLSGEARREFDLRFARGDWSESDLARITVEVTPFGQEARLLAQPFLAAAGAALKSLPRTDENAILAQMVKHAATRNS